MPCSMTLWAGSTIVLPYELISVTRLSLREKNRVLFPLNLFEGKVRVSLKGGGFGFFRRRSAMD